MPKIKLLIKQAFEKQMKSQIGKERWVQRSVKTNKRFGKSVSVTDKKSCRYANKRPCGYVMTGQIYLLGNKRNTNDAKHVITSQEYELTAIY